MTIQKLVFGLMSVVAFVGSVSANAAERLSPEEAGARHGQALGVALVCYGLVVTNKVDELLAAYSGDDANAFKAQSDKVLLLWQEARSCAKSTGPNECRLSKEWSCRDALKEIGPSGSKAAGLIEPVVK